MNTLTKGTRYMLGKEASQFRNMVSNITNCLDKLGYQEFVPSALAHQELFQNKAGPEVLGQMFSFPDKATPPRDLCLIPEVTAVCQKLFKEDWSKRLPKPLNIFYIARCYRYERQQKGRYREFWQLGVESLGGQTSKEDVIDDLVDCLYYGGLKVGNYRINHNVKRGLDYYVEDGFEVEVASLGAQKQIAGGGRYDCGIGWAIGIDRLMMSVYGEQILGQV